MASITVAPRNAERNIEVVAHIPSKNPTDGTVLQTSEQWIVGKHLYVSTIADRVYSWDISDPANPKALDSMKVDARLVNDISTTPDEKVGVFTREGASNRKNGIVFFDASDPCASESAVGIHRDRYRRRPQRVHQFALRVHHR